MARAATLVLLFLTSCLALSQARPGVSRLAARRSLAAGGTPSGWWFTLKAKGGDYCFLRDYPPRGGSGPCRLYCIAPSYSHWWMWRLDKVGGGGQLSSGDQVRLSIWNAPYGKDCGLGKRAEVLCGGPTKSTIFIIEKPSGSGAISLAGEGFYLKNRDRYCSLTGKGHSQQLICNTTARDKARATVFQFPASSFSSVRLVNKLSTFPCGGDYNRQSESAPDGVYCSSNSSYFIRPTTFVVGLQTPGAGSIDAGAGVALKVIDRLWSYSIGQWDLDGSRIKMNEVYNMWAYPSTQFFALERTSGPATGGSLTNTTEVAIRGSNGRYCGITNQYQPAIRCDATGPLSALGAGYRYTYVIATA